MRRRRRVPLAGPRLHAGTPRLREPRRLPWARETPGVGVVDAFVYPRVPRARHGRRRVLWRIGCARAGHRCERAVLAQLRRKSKRQDDIRATARRRWAAGRDACALSGCGLRARLTGTVAMSGTSTTTQLVRRATRSTRSRSVTACSCRASSPDARRSSSARSSAKAGRCSTRRGAPRGAGSGATVAGRTAHRPVMAALATYFDDLGPGDAPTLSRYPSLDVSGDAVPVSRSSR